MTAEKIIEQIKEDSQKEIEQILKDAKKQATHILKEAKKEAEQESDKILSDGTRQSENIKKILISKARQDAKRDVMNTRETIIDECFTEAHHRLSILKGNDYEKMVKKFIEDGQKKLGRNCTVLITRDTDKKIVEDLEINIAGTVESSGGVVLKSADGKITLDHTFNGILKREKDKIRIKVGKLLFP